MVDLNKGYRRHWRYYLDLLNTADVAYRLGGGRMADGLTIFDSEWTNIRLGQARAAASSESDRDAAEACCSYALLEILPLRLSTNEYLKWLDAGLAAARRFGCPSNQVKLLNQLGECYLALRKPRLSLRSHRQALAIARGTGDFHASASALGGIGLVFDVRGSGRRALRFYECQLVLCRQFGDRSGEAYALSKLGTTSCDLGKFRQGMRYLRAALHVARTASDWRHEAEALQNLSVACLARWDLHEQRFGVLGRPIAGVGRLVSKGRAVKLSLNALRISRQLSDRRAEALALGTLGSAYRLGWRDDPRRAAECHRQAAGVAHVIGDSRFEADQLYRLSLALWDSGDAESAINRAEEALDLLQGLERLGQLSSEVFGHLAAWRLEMRRDDGFHFR